MKVIQVAAELAPVAKVGGMADVVHGLSRALQSQVEDLKVIIPKYKCLDYTKIKNLEVIERDLLAPLNHQWYHNTIWQGDVDGIKTLFVETHDPFGLFERDSVYGGDKELLSFLYFSRVVIEYLNRRKKEYDIVHLHDWHTAAIAVLNGQLGLLNAKMILTLHNLSYSGKCHAFDIESIGLRNEKLEDPQDASLCNLLRGGIEYADLVTTVSPTYAKEILTGNQELSPVLHQHQKKFFGILNGIDYDYWNPEKDSLLNDHYSSNDISSSPPFIKNKEKNKKHLRSILSLEDRSAPLVATISRLVSQKGPELIKAALLHTLKRGGQFIFLGSSAEEHLQKEFSELKRTLAENRNVHIDLTFNEPMSHLVFGAADLFCIPSIFEPCGLTQLISMRYGALPIARATGGLKDTIVDKDDAEADVNLKNGFLFVVPEKQILEQTLDRAFDCMHQKPEEWKTLMKNAMSRDFSWKRSSEEYLSLYTKRNPVST